MDSENNHVKWFPHHLTKLLGLDVRPAVFPYSLSHTAPFERNTENVSREF